MTLIIWWVGTWRGAHEGTWSQRLVEARVGNHRAIGNNPSKPSYPTTDKFVEREVKYQSAGTMDTFFLSSFLFSLSFSPLTVHVYKTSLC